MDKYQGQQNQYVLLSLVRTRAVGHLRDPRRLVVAMSRARLGLYVFGRAQLFAGCYELQPTFKCVSPYIIVLFRRVMLAWEWSVQHGLLQVSLIELVPPQPDQEELHQRSRPILLSLHLLPRGGYGFTMAAAAVVATVVAAAAAAARGAASGAGTCWRDPRSWRCTRRGRPSTPAPARSVRCARSVAGECETRRFWRRCRHTACSLIL